MGNNTEGRIKSVMAAVFEIRMEQIQDNSSPDNIEAWDSLKHINLIIALEEEFQIVLSEDDIIKMQNYALVKTILITEHIN